MTQENLFDELIKKTKSIVGSEDSIWNKIENNKNFKIIFKSTIADLLKHLENLMYNSKYANDIEVLILCRYL